MDIEENQQEPENSNSAKKSKRIRNTVTPASVCRNESDKEDSFSSNDDSECEYSEDEWNVSHKKSKRNKKTVPKQTLKLKLLEKTKMLRQLSKPGSTPILVDGCEARRRNILQTSSTGNEEELETTPVEIKLESNLNENGVKASEDTKPSLDKLGKCISSTDIKNVKSESLVANVTIKNETKKVIDLRISKKAKAQCVREPIVIEYSINRAQVSQINAPSTGLPQSYSTPSSNLNSGHQFSTFQMNPFSISSQPVSKKDSNFENDVDINHVSSNHARSQLSNISEAVINKGNQCKGHVSSTQFPSNATIRTFPCRPSNQLNVTPTNRRRISKRKPNCVSSQRTPDVVSQPISTITHSNSIRIVKNVKNNDPSIARSRKVFSSDQNHRFSNVDKITKNNFESSVVRSSTPSKKVCPSLTTSTTSVLNKFGNISPNGTVIHTGTGSVTITPSKIIPEKPPTQRKLFKNEIEGTISGRNIEGTLRYVVNLANGTFIPLSNLQVEKLREQHEGALPFKLKIPVPCDVADKIEPSFLIDD